ncbi:30S ribosomal protein S3 [bacterium]|nr:30S ribosomal protein S3 [bacterium]
MGQKVSPIALRLGINRLPDSRWFAKGRRYTEFLQEDLKIRDFIKQQLKNAGISRIIIERASDTITITINTARPGIVIGRGGKTIEELVNRLQEMTGKEVKINVEEIRFPETDAQVVAETVASQIEKRVAYKRAMRQAVMRAMRAGARGIKIECSGRLAGAELARDEAVMEGKLPLSTFSADIDYGYAVALTKYGTIGVQVWIYKGEELPERREEEIEYAPTAEADEI